ncbi:MAG TPA: response regulator [Candidatus Acidoferrales bacterium]|jgi:two-component system cell cycle sensor histidine kinase/response regulator CckA|nr:response regulator [Candidatus Acidoferrales bacterium]
MMTPLNILFVEDNSHDMELVLGELRRAGFDPKWKRVQTEPDFLAELNHAPDIILSDYSMPQFNGLRAAELLQASGLNIPFILISGTVDEDVAVEAMKHGATDYLLKDRIARLPNAVERALAQKRLHDERQRTQEELVWKTAFLEAQVDAALDGILVVNNQGRQILQNQRMKDIWKIPPHIASNDDDAAQLQFVASRTKNPRQFADKIAYLYSHPDEVSRDEIELVDGTVLDRYSAPVRGKAGQRYGRIWTFRDITGQRILAEQLRQSQKMEAIGQLAGGVAHDFNNILAAIQLQASLLEAGGGLCPEQLEYSREIGTTVQRAADLTRQLLLFSRKETLQLRDLDLNKSIGDMTKMLRRTLGEAVQLRFNFAMEPLCLHADAGMLDQVLLNLAVNARDAMARGGKLAIETSSVEFDVTTAAQIPAARPGSFVCLSVSDTGCGIPPEILPRIFEPFFTTKEAGKGTGLGLATVFGIVQQHKGWVSVYSEVGRGTTFRVYLPRLAAPSGQNGIEPPVSAAVCGGTETILFVEDDFLLRPYALKILSQLGYRVFTAADGAEALDIWERHRDEIHLLLTDLVLPGGITGKDLGRRLLREHPKLKVIYTSGYSAEVVGGGFSFVEGVNFLNKPFQAKKLAQIIRERLDKPA